LLSKKFSSLRRRERSQKVNKPRTEEEFKRRLKKLSYLLSINLKKLATNPMRLSRS
jgi:hypothetical protein